MITDGTFTPANVLRIDRARYGPICSDGVPGYRVELTTRSLVSAVLSKLRGLRGPVLDGKSGCSNIFVWVPASILRHVLPRMIQQYEAKKTMVRGCLSDNSQLQC